MSKILAIDFGLKRTGLALSDDRKVFAFGLKTVESKQLMSELILLVEKEKITGLEMLELIKQMRPDLISSQAVDAVQKLLKPEPKGNA
jgi:hypothetical protein